ncbi:MAG: endonuclease domain-containing protein, partial [Calditrichales bacterium]|nr:endonuclease domain-containing protein [Calditrichales bacterium]
TFRTDHLTSLGYRVVRFTNSDVLTNITSVLDKIQNSIPDPPYDILCFNLTVSCLKAYQTVGFFYINTAVS